VDAVERHLAQAGLDVPLTGRLGAGHAAAVEAGRLARLRVVDQHERIAAQAAGSRQHDALGRRDGNRRVDGVAAVLQYAGADRRRDRVRRSDHPAQAERLDRSRSAAVVKPPRAIVYHRESSWPSAELRLGAW
jgi:hypothetical protein